ncbi:MAG: hypothetical protein EOO60_01210, partial [Hymenobacter sp.]
VTTSPDVTVSTNLGTWVNRRNLYANREVIDLLAIESNTTASQNVESTLIGEQYSRKRWMKENMYSKLPLFLRAFVYFCVRYFLQLGFLDGKPGLIWHFLQGFWYRFLVDAKLYEQQHRRKQAMSAAPAPAPIPQPL